VTVFVFSLKWNLVLPWFKAIMHHPPHSFATKLLPTLFLSQKKMSRQQQLVPISIADLEHNAHITLALNALDYYRSGANDMQTLKDNQDAFSRYSLDIVTSLTTIVNLRPMDLQKKHLQMSFFNGFQFNQHTFFILLSAPY